MKKEIRKKNRLGVVVQMHLMAYLDPKGTGVGESRKHRLASICLRFVRFGSVRFYSVLFCSVRFGSVWFGLPSAKLFYFIVLLFLLFLLFILFSLLFYLVRFDFSS